MTPATPQQTAYLEGKQLARSQYYPTRKALPSGAVVVHTSEQEPAPTAAEALARYTTTRKTPGSYHDAADDDGFIHIGRFEWQMFGEGTGGNRWAYHVACCATAADWPKLDTDRTTRIVRNAGDAAADYAEWLVNTHGVVIPARRITPAQYRNQEPGFISHGELDPGRRSDPGRAFPWDVLLDHFDAATQPLLEPTLLEPGMAEIMDELEQLFLYHRGHDNYHPRDLDGWRAELHPMFYGPDAGRKSPLEVLRYVDWVLTKETA